VFKEQFQEVRSQAAQETSQYLIGIGFRSNETGWQGQLNLGDQGVVDIRLTLPDCFPDGMPNIWIDRGDLRRRVPHVERSGKICIAPSTGVLLDADNPSGIIRDALEVAKRTLERGLAGANDEDFLREFLAYWNGGEALLTACNPSGLAREISSFCMERKQGEESIQRVILADTDNDAKRLIYLMRGIVGERMRSFFLPMASAFPPPDFDEVLTTQDTLEMLHAHSSIESWRLFQKWLRLTILPSIILIAMPNCGRHTMFAVLLTAAPAESRKRASRGFRPGKLPAWRELQFAQAQPVKRVGVERFDPAFMLPRGGALESLQHKTVCVVGCGALGSFAIERIASLGVGHLRLLDPEPLVSGNLYRHALGIVDVGVNKAKAMSDAIQAHYPHVEAQFRAEGIETVLQSDPDFILSADLILITLGDETLELRLNQLLGPKKPRIHAWLDPLGIGGHVLATAVNGRPGCFRCLFSRDEHTGLANRASFVRPGQVVQTSLAGCSGIFTPFAAIDADRTAIEAARLIAKILRGQEGHNHLLVSWLGDTEDFTQAGFTLSIRARQFQPSDCKKTTDFLAPECPHCQTWRT
jgi:hypothetical protein